MCDYSLRSPNDAKVPKVFKTRSSFAAEGGENGKNKEENGVKRDAR